MDNESGKLTGFCPLFDHDHAFTPYDGVVSQTVEEPVSLYEAAVRVQKELQMDLGVLEKMKKPPLLSLEQWKQVLGRVEKLKEFW